MDKILQTLLEKVADLHGVPEGAYNIRANGQMAGRNTTANIDIVTREDGNGHRRTHQAGNEKGECAYSGDLKPDGLK